MIFGELMKKTYAAIAVSEIAFLRFYRMDPYSMFDGMSITDFQYVMRELEKQNEQDRKDKQGDKLMKCLVQIRDLLNYMLLPEGH